MSRPATNRRLVRTAAAAGLAATLLAAGGCYWEGGYGYSDDTYAYVSRPDTPKTVTIVDWTTGDVVWTYDVPVGRRMVMRFQKDKGEEGTDRPDLMLWEDMDADRKNGALTNRLAVPAYTNRRVDMTLRPSPELPPAAFPQAAPQQPVVPIDPVRHSESDTATPARPTNTEESSPAGVRRRDDDTPANPPPIDLEDGE